jgi:hypothetical protein
MRGLLIALAFMLLCPAAVSAQNSDSCNAIADRMLRIDCLNGRAAADPNMYSPSSLAQSSSVPGGGPSNIASSLIGCGFALSSDRFTCERKE